jgi:selT/selW/selH-like putative selenoprotein
MCVMVDVVRCICTCLLTSIIICSIFLFLILPQVIGQWKTTGAFEIYLDGDQVIHSKLATGDFPKVREIVSEAMYRRGCSLLISPCHWK